jgi:hypothetical protein
MTEPTIDPTESNPYPAWQEEIRAAQASVRAEIEAERIKVLEEQAARELRLGGLLEGALSDFGIDVPGPLITNRFEIDGIRFLISHYCKDDELMPTLVGSNMRREPIFDYHLEVGYVLEGKYASAQEDYEDYSIYKTLAIRHDFDNPDWTQEHAQLADAIDSVTANGKAFMAKVDNWETAVPPTPLPTFSQQLENVLREIVRDELMKQDIYED